MDRWEAHGRQSVGFEGGAGDAARDGVKWHCGGTDPAFLDTFAALAHNPAMKSGQLTPVDFVAKWSRVELSERAASQEHFIDLCRMLGQPTPAEHDATGAEYTFEKGVAVTGSASAGSKGEHGFADVWWRGKFAWEYKRRGKYKDLADAYRQLCVYREALDNPPLLIVSDIERTEIHSNFTGTAKQVHIVRLQQTAEPFVLDLLRRVFTDPESFKPTLTPKLATKQIAAEFGRLTLICRAHPLVSPVNGTKSVRNPKAGQFAVGGSAMIHDDSAGISYPFEGGLGLPVPKVCWMEVILFQK